jgi:hypothetical protein
LAPSSTSWKPNVLLRHLGFVKKVFFLHTNGNDNCTTRLLSSSNCMRVTCDYLKVMLIFVGQCKYMLRMLWLPRLNSRWFYFKGMEPVSPICDLAGAGAISPKYVDFLSTWFCQAELIRLFAWSSYALRTTPSERVVPN